VAAEDQLMLLGMAKVSTAQHSTGSDNDYMDFIANILSLNIYYLKLDNSKLHHNVVITNHFCHCSSCYCCLRQDNQEASSLVAAATGSGTGRPSSLTAVASESLLGGERPPPQLYTGRTNRRKLLYSLVVSYVFNNGKGFFTVATPSHCLFK